MNDDLIHKIEKQRVELEANIAKLRSSLHHWTTLELDYEGLKDEFQTLRQDATKCECLAIARDFHPYKVNEKELTELVEPSRGKARSPLQIVEVLSKRVEYVLRNADSLRKQIADLEKRRNAVLLAANPNLEADAVLPITEITEELDNDGNVVSSNAQRQGDSAKKVLEVLEKTKARSGDDKLSKTESAQLGESRIQEIHSSDEDKEDVSVQPSTHVEGDVRETATTQSNKSLPVDRYPTNPQDNEEEAQMRSEMIQYGLGEVGNIVAELELMDANIDPLQIEDEEMADDLSDEDYEHDDFSGSSLDDELEDENGRSTVKVHTDKYRSRMEELEKQLGFKMENTGPMSNDNDNRSLDDHVERLHESDFKDQMNHLPPEFQKRFSRPSAAEAARKAALAREKASRSAAENYGGDNTEPKAAKSKKNVAFAPSIEIAPELPTTNSATISDTITKRTMPESSTARGNPLVKVSQVKATRASQPQTPLYPPPIESPLLKQNLRTGPAGKIISKDLVERAENLSTKTAPPPDADDFDEELQQRQIALEHHRLRNKMIHESGGYVKGGEAENWGEPYAPSRVEHEKTGEPVKISRFKAARLRP